MKLLKDILYKVSVNKIYGSKDVQINKVVFDSRKVEKNDLFVAQKGLTVDGHKFIDKVVELGALVVTGMTQKNHFLA